MDKLRFEISAELPSANELVRRRGNYMAEARHRKEFKAAWCKLIRYEAFQQINFKPPRPEDPPTFHRARVSMLVRRRRLTDDTNLYAPADKLILDNLVLLRIIPDDSPRFLKWAEPIKQEKCGKEEQPGVIVTLTREGYEG